MSLYKNRDGYKRSIHVINNSSNRTGCSEDDSLAPLNASAFGRVGGGPVTTVGFAASDVDVATLTDVGVILSTVLELLVWVG